MKKLATRVIVIFLMGLVLSPLCQRALAQLGVTVSYSITDENLDGFEDVVFQAFDSEGEPASGIEVEVFLDGNFVFSENTGFSGRTIFYDPPIGSYSWQSSSGQSGSFEIGEHVFSIDDTEELILWLVAVNFMDSPNRGRSLYENIAEVLGYDLLEHPMPLIDGTNSEDNSAIATEWIKWSNGLVKHIDEMRSTHALTRRLSKSFLDIICTTRAGFAASHRFAAHGAYVIKHVEVADGLELRLTDHLQFRGGLTYRVEGAGLSLASIVLASLDLMCLSQDPTTFETINIFGATVDTRAIQIGRDFLYIMSGVAGITFYLVKYGRSALGNAAMTILGTGAAVLSAVITILDITEALQERGFEENWNDPEFWIEVLSLISSLAVVTAGIVTMLGWVGVLSLSTASAWGTTLVGIASGIGLVVVIAALIVFFWKYFETLDKVREQMSPLLTELWRIRSELGKIDLSQIRDDSIHSLALASAAGELIGQINKLADLNSPLHNLRNQLRSASYYWAHLGSVEARLADDIETTLNQIDEFVASAHYKEIYFGPIHPGAFSAHSTGILSIEADCEIANPFSVNSSYHNPDLADYYFATRIHSSDGNSLLIDTFPADYSFLSRSESGTPKGWAWDIPVESDDMGQEFAVSYNSETETFLFDADGTGDQFGEYYEYTVPRRDEAGNLETFYLLKFYIDECYPAWLEQWSTYLFGENGKFDAVSEALEDISESMSAYEEASTYRTHIPKILFEDAHDTDDDELSGNYLELKRTIEEEGFLIEDVKTRPVSYDLLTTYDAVILPDLEIGLSVGEIIAFAQFLDSGGRLLIIGEWKGAHIPTTVSAVSRVAGIEFDDTIVYDPDNHIGYDYWVVIHEVDSTHCIGSGISNFAMYAGSSLVLTSDDAHAIACGDENTYTLDPSIGPNEPDWNVTDPEAPELGDPIVLAVSEYSVKYGKTRLVCIGDSDLWKTDSNYIEDFDNKQLLRNIINWLWEPVAPQLEEETEFETITEGETKTSTVSVSKRTEALEVTLSWPGSHLDLHIYDQMGNHIGLNYETDLVEIEVSGAEYSGHSVRPEWIRIPNPQPGIWTVEVSGVEVEGTELFRLDVSQQQPVDTTPPTTSLEISSPKYVDAFGNIYITSSTPLTLDATDNGETSSGVASTSYRVYDSSYDSGWVTVVPPIFLQIDGLNDGTYFIDYNSTDNAGNVESTNTANVTLDNTPPTTTLTIGEPKYYPNMIYVTQETPFTIESTEVGSGINSTTYRIYNATYETIWYSYKSQFNLTGLSPGNYSIEYKSTDNVGNTDTNSTNVKLRMPMDVNNDGRINMKDISLAGKAFGSFPTHPRWNSLADTNSDNIIDLKDVSKIARNYGKEY